MKKLFLTLILLFLAMLFSGKMDYAGNQPEIPPLAGGGAIVGATNAWLNGAKSKDIVIGASVGAVSGFAGGAAGYAALNASFVVNGISSPVLRSAVVSPLAAGAGHIAGGTTANLIAGQNLGDAFANSFEGLGKSMAINGAIGVAATIGVSYANGVSPWTGKLLTQPNTHKKLSYTDKQIGHKFGEHLNSELKGYGTIDEYRQLANDIYNNSLSIKTTYPLDAPMYRGETHYYWNGNLLRLDQNGYFKSLYPYNTIK